MAKQSESESLGFLQPPVEPETESQQTPPPKRPRTHTQSSSQSEPVTALPSLDHSGGLTSSGPTLGAGNEAPPRPTNTGTTPHPVSMAIPPSSSTSCSSAAQLAPALTLESVVDVVRSVKNWYGLGYWLHVPESELDLIRRCHNSQDERLQSVIQCWLLRSPSVSWRELIDALDWGIESEVANPIRSWAEPVRDSTLTVQNVSTLLQPVRNWRQLVILPDSMMDQLEEQHISEQEEKNVIATHYVQTDSDASWEHLADLLYQCDEQRAVEAVRNYWQAPRDPTLTSENLMTVLEEVQDWDKLGRGLYIPDSKLKEITEHYPTDNQCKVAVVTHWLQTHPAPGWNRMARALRYMDRNSLAGIVTTKYVRASEESKQIFDAAMKHGVIKARNLKFLVMGFAGVGKSHVLAMILGERPPGIRSSTPCLTRPVRLRRIGKMGKQWGRMGETEMTVLVARAAKAQPLASAILCDPTPLQSPVRTSEPTQQKSEVRAKKSPRKHQAHQNQPPSEADKPLDSPRHSVPSPMVNVEDRLLKMIDDASSFIHIKLDLITAVDTGGQPNFLEVLAKYLDKNTTIIVVLKLSEELDAYPVVEYYDENGEPLGVPYPSGFTNGQTVRGCLRAVQSQVMKSSKGKSPKVVIIGTHKDLENSCSETRAEKNAKLIDMMVPEIQDEVLYYGEQMKEVVFPVNAKAPGSEDENIAAKLREIIVEKSSVEPTDIPLQWYGLDIALQQLMKVLNRGVLSKTECRDVAARFHFSEKSFEEALKHLTGLSIIHYYDAVLPEVVFVDPQVPLDKFTELVQYSYKLREDPTSCKVTQGHLRKFRNQGIVTADILKEFPRHYIRGLFGPSELLQLFTADLVVAQVQPGEYFMPSLLQVASDKEQCQHQSPIEPLLVYFPHGDALLGVFCAFISYLLSHVKWKLLMHRSTPVHVTRNSIAFEIPGDVPGRLIVSDSLSSYFKVSVCLSPSLSSAIYNEVCPRIREDVSTGILKACISLGYDNYLPREAFFCPVQGKECSQSAHPAILDGNCRWSKCSMNPDVCGTVTGKHRVWFGTAEPEKQSIPSASGLDESNHSINLDSTPTLVELLSFPASQGRTINIPQEIGTKYNTFGILLLKDRTGAMVDGIVHKHLRDPVQINIEILKKWVRGEAGEKPVSWRTLITCLRNSGMSTLADDMQQALL